ncbi:MAG: c-type cytochrome domain-containing protein [Chloroflexota bacterium]
MEKSFVCSSKIHLNQIKYLLIRRYSPMNKNIFSSRVLLSVALVIVFSIFVAACSAGPAPEIQVANPPVEQATSTSPVNSNAAAAPASSNSAADVSFSKQILPILQESCVSCHGGEKTSKGLDLKTFASVMKGSQNGAVIIAGDAAGSNLLKSVQSGKMPKRGNKLTADQIQLFVDWVNAGAKDN